MLTQRLRHRITIQAQTQTQDATTGAVVITWTDYLADEPAECVPLSGREFIQAKTLAVEVSARFTIRWRDGLDASMRIVFDGALYQITAILPDPSARRWLTIMARWLEPFGDVGEEPVEEATPATWGAHSAFMTLANGDLTATTTHNANPVQTAKSNVAHSTGKHAARIQLNYSAGAGTEETGAGVVDNAFDPTTQNFQTPDAAHTCSVMSSGDVYDMWETIYLTSLSGPIASGGYIYVWVDANKVWVGLDPDAPLGDPEAGTDPVFTFDPGTEIALVCHVWDSHATPPNVVIDPTWTHGTFAAWGG